MDGQAKTINAAGHMTCRVSVRSDGEGWQDGRQRAFHIGAFQFRFGMVLAIGESVEDGGICYTRAR